MSALTLRSAATEDDLTVALADQRVRENLEQQLPAWLRQQRWFGGHTRTLTAVTITAWLAMPDTTTPPTVLCLLRATDDHGFASQHPLFLYATPDGVITEALAQPAVQQRLLRLILAGETLAGSGLQLQGEPTTVARKLSPTLTSRLSSAEQSNSSVIYGDQAIMKVYRRLEAGPNPELTLGRYLSVEAGFRAVPQIIGAGRLMNGDQAVDDAMALLLLQELVPNQGDAWEWAVTECQAALQATTPAALSNWLQEYPTLTTTAEALGQITAQMHATLAAATAVGLAPQVATPTDLATWTTAINKEATLTLQAVEQMTVTDPRLQQALIRIQHTPPPNIATPGLITRVHGDYHLGQVIRGAAGLKILDFEGEPARPLAYRQRHQHPLVDVAGMLRSLDYAAFTAAGNDQQSTVAAALSATLQQRFLAAYWAEADNTPTPFLPPAKASRLALLRLFIIAKALYELRYELANRPAMVTIPANAIKRLIGFTDNE